jgi:hypothetical protein
MRLLVWGCNGFGSHTKSQFNVLVYAHNGIDYEDRMTE